MGRKAVMRKYLQGWFTLDLVSSFPIDLLLFGKRSDLWRLPRLLKVLLSSLVPCTWHPSNPVLQVLAVGCCQSLGVCAVG